MATVPSPFDTLESTGQRSTHRGASESNRALPALMLRPRGASSRQSGSHPPLHGVAARVPVALGQHLSQRALTGSCQLFLLALSPLIGHLVRAKSQLGVFLVGDLFNESGEVGGGRVLGLSGHSDRSLPSQKAPPCHCPQDKQACLACAGLITGPTSPNHEL